MGRKSFRASIIVFSLSLLRSFTFLRGDASAGWNIHSESFGIIFVSLEKQEATLNYFLFREHQSECLNPTDTPKRMREEKKTPHVLKDDLSTEMNSFFDSKASISRDILEKWILKSISHVKPLTSAFRWKMKFEKHFSRVRRFGNRLFINGMRESSYLTYFQLSKTFVIQSLRHQKRPYGVCYLRRAKRSN